MTPALPIRRFVLHFFLTLAIALALGVGFFSSSTSLIKPLIGQLPYKWAQSSWALEGLPPLLLALFFERFGSQRKHYPVYALNLPLWKISLLPLVISFLSSSLIWGKSLKIVDLSSFFSFPMLWSVAFIPVIEECLFRGWLIRTLENYSPQTVCFSGGGLPLSLLLSAMAFSLWHLQNLESLPWFLMVLQLFCTFMVGVWLGVITLEQRSLLPAIFAHAALNFVFLI